MKRRTGTFLLFMILFGGIYFSSCSDNPPTTGTLTVTVLDSLGQPIPYANVNLAATFSDLRAKNFIKTYQTTVNGDVYFADLKPMLYWYNSDKFKDLGAVQVYAGKDYFVTLYENSPGKK
jgi:hypothetical protein